MGVVKVVLAVAAAALVLGGTTALARTSAATVNVVEREFTLKPSRASAKAGQVTFVVRNAGKLAHEFVVLRTNRPARGLPTKGARAVETGKQGKIPPFKAGQTRRLTLTLKAGKYVLICNVPAHYKAGQSAAFRVS